MATDLFPTPTRLALLADVDAGNVLHRQWQLTDAGRAVLDQHRRAET